MNSVSTTGKVPVKPGECSVGGSCRGETVKKDGVRNYDSPDQGGGQSRIQQEVVGDFNKSRLWSGWKPDWTHGGFCWTSDHELDDGD